MDGAGRRARLLEGGLSFSAEGPDGVGVFVVLLLRTATGEAVARIETHWRALVPSADAPN